MASEEKPYKLKTDPISQVVYAYKVRQGARIDDRNWDSGDNFKRVSAAAKKLIAIVETVDNAKQCITEIANRCDNWGVEWSLDGAILKHAPMWMVEKKKQEETKKRMEHIKNCKLCDRNSSGDGSGWITEQDEEGEWRTRECRCRSEKI